MEQFILTVLKDGTLAFIGCKITKALGEDEISDLIRAGGWATIGISGAAVILPIIREVSSTFVLIREVGNKLSWIWKFTKIVQETF